MWIFGCSLITLGDVASCEVDGFVPCTLGTGLGFSVLTFVAVLKISVNCCNASVCFVLRLIGALLSFDMATMRSCAASLIVSPGSIAGILQCTGKNFAPAKIL